MKCDHGAQPGPSDACHHTSFFLEAHGQKKQCAVDSTTATQPVLVMSAVTWSAIHFLDELATVAV
jgi:hypothetical protein